jgi:hypothetical protein
MVVMNRPISARMKTVKASRAGKPKALPPSCFVPQPLRSWHGLGWVGLHTISVVYSAHMVRPTAYRNNNVPRHIGYLCVRSFTSSWDSRADVGVQALYTKYDSGKIRGQSGLRRSFFRLCTPRLKRFNNSACVVFPSAFGNSGFTKDSK